MGSALDDSRTSLAPRPLWSIGDRAIFKADQRPAGKVHERAIGATLKEHRDVFVDRDEVRQLLARICLPASERWAFVVTGRAATTTTLALLFEAEFGVPFSVRARVESNPNESVGLHALMWHDVFSAALSLPRSLGNLAEDRTLERIAVVRHPANRAASAFHYLCRSNAEARWDFFADRVKMASMFGLNFETMAGKSNGFVRFLEYVAADFEENGRTRVNTHWRPQSLLIFPQQYRPTLIGKCEFYSRFQRELFERLDRPNHSTKQHLNRSDADTDSRRALFEDPAAARLVRQLYEDDFGLFGYESY